MKKLYSTLISLCLSFFLYSQGNSFQWAKSVGGNNNDYGNLITTDVSGNVYVSGTFIGKADFNPGAGSDTLDAITGPSYLMKLDASGNYLWAINFDYTIISMKCDAVGNIISTGYFQNTVDFDMGPGTFLMSGYATNGYKDIFISKTDASGNFVWAKHVGGNFIDQAFALTLDAVGNIYYTGQYGYGADFDPGPSTYTLTTVAGPNTDSDIFVSKMDANGNFIWAKGMGGYNDEKGLSITVDPSGNVYTTGVFGGGVDFDPGMGTYYLNSTSYYDFFVSKLDASGNFVWAKCSSGTGSDHTANTIAIDGASNLYVSGYFDGTMDCDPSASVYNLTTTGGGYIDAFVMKLDNAGNFIWAKNFGGNEDDVAHSMALDAASNVYMTGSFNGIADFDPSVGIYNLRVTNIPFQGTEDIFISKLDSSGNFIWAENFGGLQADVPNSIAIDISGNLYTTGYFTNTGDFDPGGTTYSLSGTAASMDVFIHKMSPCTSPAAPVIIGASSQTICSDATATFSVSGTPMVYWYNNDNPGTNLGLGFAFTTPTLAIGSYTYYAETSSCTFVGSRTPINLTVIPSPTITVSNGSLCKGQSFTITPSGASTYTYSGGLSVVSPTTTTAYTVTGSSSNGCSNNTGAVCTLSVYITPTINVVCSPTLVCFGSGSNVSQTGAAFVHWSYQAGASYGNAGGSALINPTVTTTYTVGGYDASFTCFASENFTLYVEPGMTAVPDKDTVCMGSSVTFSINGVSAYNIQPPFTSAISPVFVVTPSVTTYYYINGSTSAGCSYSTSKTIIVDSTCADVWPGDANSDGLADNLDVLELGLHYTQTGLPRASISNTWQSYFAGSWTGMISNGLNLNHSDCNGDGTIDANDTLAIYNNYGLTHAFKTVQTNTINPQLSIIPDQAAVAKGTWGTASIYLGDAATNVNSINGIAFTVDFDNTLIETNSVYIEYQNSFIDAGQNLHFRKLDFSNNKLFTASTHTVNNNVNGYGKIATLHYQINSTLTTDQVLNLGISQANQSDATGAIVPLTSGVATLMAMGASVGLQELNSSLISISPNPTNGSLTINSKTELQKVEVVSITGQTLLSETSTNVSLTLHLENFTNGIYFVNVHQNDRIVKREKIVLNK